ncbi:MAG: chemotaxis protein CheA [Pseudomonadota bacterium]
MPIDIRQFHQTFFEESTEGLAMMEQLLLQMEGAAGSRGMTSPDPENLNSIFRVVHSIKGGSSTFGFGWLADFSHLLETALDDLRAGRRQPDRETTDLLLRSVDALRNLLEGARTGAAIDKTRIEEIASALEVPSVTKAAEASTAEAPEHGWHVSFQPGPELFRSGNDPLRIIRELGALGTLQVSADVSRLPRWEAYDPETCYLGWQIKLSGRDQSRQAVKAAFEWVADISEITLAPMREAKRSEGDTPPASGDGDHTLVKARGPSIRVSTARVDSLMDIVGELVITQTMISETVAQFTPADLPRLLVGLTQLERNVRQLQESVISIRLLPIGFVYSRLPRLIRDLAQRLGKQVDLELSGEQTELDKTVIERISDPLLHMVRNCLDHGIETPAERRRAGKPETGHLRVHAHQKSGYVHVVVEDDGRGLSYEQIRQRAVQAGLLNADTRPTPEQMHELIFYPGFSTASEVSDISGRGVGLDVVRENIRSLGGSVEVSSTPGSGTRFTLRLPLTLAIMDGLSILIGDQTYLLPLTSIVESIHLTDDRLSRLPDGQEIFALREDYLGLIRLHELFHIPSRHTDVSQGIVVVVEVDGRRAGLYVDELLGQQQVVIKNIESHYQRVDGISAATILGDGTVALILDVAGLMRLSPRPVMAPDAPGCVPRRGSPRSTISDPRALH